MGSSVSNQSINVQHPNNAADICRPLVDSVKVWEGIAAAEYAFDGVLDGWDSDSEMPQESAEDKYLQVSLSLHQSVKFGCHSTQVCILESKALCHPFGHDILSSFQHDGPFLHPVIGALVKHQSAETILLDEVPCSLLCRHPAPLL